MDFWDSLSIRYIDCKQHQSCWQPHRNSPDLGFRQDLRTHYLIMSERGAELEAIKLVMSFCFGFECWRKINKSVNSLPFILDLTLLRDLDLQIQWNSRYSISLVRIAPTWRGSRNKLRVVPTSYLFYQDSNWATKNWKLVDESMLLVPNCV